MENKPENLQRPSVVEAIIKHIDYICDECLVNKFYISGPDGEKLIYNRNKNDESDNKV